MKFEPADNRLIEALRCDSLSTHVHRLIARLDQERKRTSIAQAAVRHAVQRNHDPSDACSGCEHILKILEIG